jgi:mono/diheme cytochrome c family protein
MKNNTVTHRRTVSMYGVAFVGLLFLVFSYIDYPGSNPTNPESLSDWIAPAWVDTLVSPITDVESSVKQASAVFGATCAICHGNSGKGDGVAGVALKPRPANLTSDKVQDQSDGALFWKLSTGKAPMPTYKDLLSDRQRWEMVAFVRSLKKK